MQKNNINKYFYRFFSRRKDCISVTVEGPLIGQVLLSYILNPFLLKYGEPIPNSHTNHWECLQIARTFLEFGYGVDVIDWTDRKFIPKRNYSFFIDIHSNLERIAPFLNQDCVKVLHITGAHWLFQNQAEYRRLLALQQRRGVTLMPRRIVPPSQGIEYADCATILGNQFTISTFTYAEKPIYRIPISTPVLYSWPEDKDYDYCRNRFLWFGSSGMVHKGLDLVLEAFAEMPKYHLTVCGPVQNEKDFENAFCKYLYQTHNIETIGWVDVGSSQFREITKNCIGLIYPSCSEGGGGSVVTCMHAGLIPIVSYESSVDVDNFGLTLKQSSIEEIKESTAHIANLPGQELKFRARKAWETARANYTRENFAHHYKKFANLLLGTRRN